MVKKNTGGKKFKKKKNNGVSNDVERPLVLKVDGEEYAQVVRLLGSCRLEAKCLDGKTRLCHIRGTMRKKVWIQVNDLVLVSLREYEDNKADVIYKYVPKEIKKLKDNGEIPDTLAINDVAAGEKEDDIGFQFENSESEDEETTEDEKKKLTEAEIEML